MRIPTIRAIFQWTFGTFLVLYLLLMLALDSSRVQAYMGDWLESQLEQQLGAEVEIGRAELGLFNSVHLHDVLLEDKQGKELITSKLIFGKIELRSLLYQRISLRNIALFDTRISLYQAKGARQPNFQFVLDAFKGDGKSKTPLHLRINSFLMRRGEVSFHHWGHPRPAQAVFSSHHIHLRDIDANFSLKHLTKDSINLRIRQLQLKEDCGLQIKQLNLHLTANRKGAVVENLALETGNSRLAQEKIEMQFDATRDVSHWGKTLQVSGYLADARVSTRDIAYFVPRIQSMQQELTFSTDYRITPQRIATQQLELSNQQQSLVLRGGFELLRRNGKVEDFAADILQLHVAPSMVERFYALTQRVPEQHAALPKWLENLGSISLNGKGVYRSKSRSYYQGELASQLGLLKADLYYQNHTIGGEISSAAFQPHLVQPHEWMPTALDFVAKGEVRLVPQSLPEGQLNLDIQSVTIKDRTYQNLLAKAALTRGKAQVDFDVNDPNTRLSMQASAMLDAKFQPSDLAASLQVERFSPSALGLTQQWGAGVFSGQLEARLPHLRWQQPEGEISVSNFTLTGDQPDAEPYHLRSLQLRSQQQGERGQLTLSSDFADLQAHGLLTVPAIQFAISRWLATVTRPMRSGQPMASSTTHSDASALTFAGTLKRTDFLNRLLHLNLEANAPIHVDGLLAQNGRRMQLNAVAEDLKVANNQLRNVSLIAHSQGEQLQLLVKGRKPMKHADLQLELAAHTEGARVHAQAQWRELRQQQFYGQLNTITTLHLPQKGTKQQLAFSTDILPTEMAIEGRVWQMQAGNVALRNGQIDINRVALTHADQHLAIAGAYAKNREGLIIDLQRVDVGSAIALTGFDDVTFGGKATGRGILRPADDGKVMLEAHLDIPDFHFNDASLGHAKVSGGFDGHGSTILLNADIREPQLSHTEVEGYVSLGRKELDLRVKSENTSLGFLRTYTTGIFEELEGRATGYCRVFGGFKSIDFEGYERGSAKAKVPVTGVTYWVDNADVTILPGEFRLDRADISDKIKGSGTVRGALKHTHLKQMNYDFTMRGADIKLYDRPYELDMPFYATAYGSGDVHLFGAPGAMTANIRVVTDPRATLTYVLDSPDAADQQLVKFRSAIPQDTAVIDSLALAQTTTSQLLPKKEDTKTDIRLNMDVTVQPSATLKMITDFKSGDVITVHGSGPIQASFYNKGAFQMFGTYQIDRGEYDLSIQNVIKKTFTLLPNGTVTFSGPPQDADVNVKAQYTVNSASLADLNIGSGFTNNTTPVNCLVNFTGRMSNMNLALDFDLPNVGEDEKMMVRNLIASDEDRTMQVLYLLGVGRFFTYNYGSTESAAGQSQSAVMMKSLLTNTLSSQINNIIANAVGASNWTFGANVATGQLGWEDMEVDGSLSGRLFNNRLLVNGKVGYHERQAATTNFVGDFKVNYLITPSGSINLKAYSETNDRYFSKSTLTTQGVGIQFKRDFSSLRDLFSRKPKKSKQEKKRK